MGKDIGDKLKAELADWKTKLEGLRVKASLGKMELRDKERELAEKFEPAYTQAMKKLAELRDDAGDEAKALRAGLEAGWGELRRAYTAARDENKKPKSKGA
jgi:hypothetical protein